MKCPVCKTKWLESVALDADLDALECPQCRGHWIKSYQYWRWRQRHGDALPMKPPEDGAMLPVKDSKQAKLCPECGRLLIRYKVGKGIDFRLDHCGHCGGVWFDDNEWETLKSRNLHDEIHFIFTESWQARIRHEEQAAAEHQRLVSHLGEADLRRLEEIKAWLDGHPHKAEMHAFLMGRH